MEEHNVAVRPLLTKKRTQRSVEGTAVVRPMLEAREGKSEVLEAREERVKVKCSRLIRRKEAIKL